MAILFDLLIDLFPKVAGIREDPDGCDRPYRPLSGFLFIGGYAMEKEVDGKMSAVWEAWQELENSLDKVACKLSAVAFALSHDACVPSKDDAWGMCYILEDCKSVLQRLAKGIEGVNT